MNKHQSQRGYFAYELYEQMKTNDKVYLVCGDLGYKVFDNHFKDFPERTVNTGASEMGALAMSIGLALDGKIPFFYSITTFLIYRPFELIRNYLVHEQIPVKLVGSGRDKDYAHDGVSHWSTDINLLFGKNKILKKIQTYFPETKEEVPQMTSEMVSNNKPSFISLQR